MMHSGKYQIATPGQSSRPMSLSEINLGLASGEVLPEDQYWSKGMPRWEKVKDMPGVLIPSTPKNRVVNDASAPTQPKDGRSAVGIQNQNNGTTGSLSFWSQPDHRPRLAVWSPTMYFWLSVIFTPLVGTVMMVQNHRATDERIWRGIASFWLMIWSAFVVAAVALHFSDVPCGSPLYWGIGYATLAIGWCFTCAFPHHNFLRARTYEAAWRSDWGKLVGISFTAWVVIITVFLLTR